MAKLLKKNDIQSRIEHFYKILFKFIVFFYFPSYFVQFFAFFVYICINKIIV